MVKPAMEICLLLSFGWHIAAMAQRNFGSYKGKTRFNRRRPQQQSSSVGMWLLLALAGAFVILHFVNPSSDTAPSQPLAFAGSGEAAASTYYRYCDEARAAGRAPLYKGQAGYRQELDRDGDGVACEPYLRN